jgi:hypothetical protein
MAAALLVVGATACSDLTGNVSAQGAFSLVLVNGVRVPFVFTDQNTGDQVEVDGDTYVLNSNGSYNDQQISRVNGVTQSGFEVGTWSQSGNTVFFTPTQSDFDLIPYQGTVRNDNSLGGSRTLTISINGRTAEYTAD